MSLKICILISGRGSNMQAIQRAILAKKLDAEIKAVVSNKADAAGLQYAQSHGLKTIVLEKIPGQSRENYQQGLMKQIDTEAPDLLVLAGFMQILSADFVNHFKNRIVNIHPSLLPAFPGLHAQRQALEAGVKFSGCTVHFVDEGCDTGPIIAQRSVPVLATDDEASLSARILEQEHQLYPECLQGIATQKIKLEEKK